MERLPILILIVKNYIRQSHKIKKRITNYKKSLKDRYPKSYVDFKNRIKSVSQISMGFSKPKKLIFRNTVPPTAKKNNDGTFISYTFSSLFGSDKQVYVPDALLTTYRTAEGWSDYISQIHPLSEFSADDYDEDE